MEIRSLGQILPHYVYYVYFGYYAFYRHPTMNNGGLKIHHVDPSQLLSLKIPIKIKTHILLVFLWVYKMLPVKLLFLARQRFEWLTQLCPKFETSQEQSILIRHWYCHHKFSNSTNPQTKQRQSIDIKQSITNLYYIIIKNMAT